MFENGFLVTRSTKDKVKKGPLGVRKWKPEKCWNGYNLFSQAFGSTEYLMDMSGRIVHRWPVTHSQYAVLMPNGNLVAGNYGNFVQEIKPDGTEIWRYGASLGRTGEWGGLGLSNPYHHDFDLDRKDTIYVLANKQEPVCDGFYEEGIGPDYMLTDMVLRIDRSDNEVEWSFSFSDHIEEISNLSGLPLPVPFRCYVGPEEDEEVNDCVESEPYKDGLLLTRSPSTQA